MKHPFIGGAAVVGKAGERKVIDPYNGEVVDTITYADASQITDAVTAAQNAFQITKEQPPIERAEVLHKTSELLQKRKEEFALLITKESGKPITYSRIEVDRAVFTFASAADAADMFEEDVPVDLSKASNGAGRTASYRYFSLGVIAAITPFNFPLNLVAHKVAPAIASGNTVVLKPAPQTPLTSLLLADIMQEAGLTPGALNVVPCENDVAELLVKDDRVKMLSFTGSAAVGWHLKSLVPKKKVTLELGGNGSVIVDEVQDWDSLLKTLTTAGYYYAGQVCISLQNLFVNREIYDEVITKFVEASKNVTVGDPRIDSTVVGPMISPQAADKSWSWVEDAVSHGAKKLTGSRLSPNTIAPTILTDAPEASKVRSEEVFAPVVVVTPYDDIDDVISTLNRGKYGLQTGLFTSKPSLIEHVYEELETGGLIVNDATTFRVDTMPYGGVKESGFGREGVEYAMREMSEMKLVVRR
jgi:glyceraldehyde-3-phosphate dehydrogenase (NADP+)